MNTETGLAANLSGQNCYLSIVKTPKKGYGGKCLAGKMLPRVWSRAADYRPLVAYVPVKYMLLQEQLPVLDVEAKWWLPSPCPACRP